MAQRCLRMNGKCVADGCDNATVPSEWLCNLHGASLKVCARDKKESKGGIYHLYELLRPSGGTPTKRLVKGPFGYIQSSHIPSERKAGTRNRLILIVCTQPSADGGLFRFSAAAMRHCIDPGVLGLDIPGLKEQLSELFEPSSMENLPKPGLPSNASLPSQSSQPTQSTPPPGKAELYVIPSEDASELSISKLKKAVEEATEVMVDCEGKHLGPEGTLTLVQLHFPQPPRTFLLNVFALNLEQDGKISEECKKVLRELLEADRITKVFHDCRCDCYALRRYLSIDSIGSIVDTQILKRLIEDKKGDKIKQLHRVGFETLWMEVTNENSPVSKSTMHGNYRTDPDYWCTLTLSEEQVQYARHDVEGLWRIYQSLNKTAIKEQVDMTDLKALSQCSSFYYKESVEALSASEQEDASDTSDEELKELLAFLPEKISKEINRTWKEHQAEYTTCDIQLQDIRLRRTQLDLHFDKPNTWIIVKAVTKADCEEALNCFCQKLVKQHEGQDIGALEQEEEEEESAVQPEDIARMVGQLNRTGIKGTLHRIGLICARGEDLRGMTIRIGRHIPRANQLLPPFHLGVSMLLVGVPGSGKTTSVRAIIAEQQYNYRVVVVDSSGELTGFDGDHASASMATCLPVGKNDKQLDVLMQAVSNHNPELAVVDEIGEESEARAIEDFKQRSVCVITSVHAKRFVDIQRNPKLRLLLGRTETVTYGAAELQKKDGNTIGDDYKKVRLERVSDPVFDCVVEQRSPNHVVIYDNVKQAADLLLLDKIGAEIPCRHHFLEQGQLRKVQYDFPHEGKISDWFQRLEQQVKSRET